MKNPTLRFLLATGGSKMVVLENSRQTEVYANSEETENNIRLNKILETII